jgi:DNA-binding GntR family transcriptional regulator
VVIKPSKAERVFTQLRADILSGRLQPGERLRYTELCERYGTSMGVLREGLLRLAEQGLARGELQQGFQVTPLSTEDLLELTEARRELESLTLRRAIADGDVEWEARLLAAHHRLSRAPIVDPQDPERLSDTWVAAHADFHEALLNGCANQRLKNMATALRDSAELYRSWSLPLGRGSSARDVATEHSDILEAAVARHSERAVDLLLGHIDRTTSSLLALPLEANAGSDTVGAGHDGRTS